MLLRNKYPFHLFDLLFPLSFRISSSDTCTKILYHKLVLLNFFLHNHLPNNTKLKALIFLNPTLSSFSLSLSLSHIFLVNPMNFFPRPHSHPHPQSIFFKKRFKGENSTFRCLEKKKN